MSEKLAERLNQIFPRITDPAFLKSRGIGNEIACWIFDYPADQELLVREAIAGLQKQLAKQRPDLQVLTLNLLDVVLDYLQQRKLLTQALEMEAKRGSQELLKALSKPLSAEKIRDYIAQTYALPQQDLILVTGVGSVWPVLRMHNLLNCLHAAIDHTPLVMFYPGQFDGTALRIFGQATVASSTANAYYRAFSLIPRGSIA